MSKFLFLNLPIPKNIKPKLLLYCKFFSLENGFSERITIIVKKNELVKTIKSINKEIILTGGGALTVGLDKLLESELKVPVKIAESPLTCVAEGTGILLNNINLIDR